MRTFLLSAALLALTPAFAQAQADPSAADARVHAIRHEVREDRRDLREERRELKQAHRELRRDRHELHRAKLARAKAWHRHHHG